MLLALLILATTLHAADLHVKVTPPGGEPVGIDFPDVRFGTLPGFTVPAVDGSELIVHITLAQYGDPAPGEAPLILFDVVIQELRAGKRDGAGLKVLSHPRVGTHANTPAWITVGFSPRGGRSPDDGLDLSIEMIYSDPNSPDPAAAGEPAPVDSPAPPR
jgi:hypothetical protein